MIKENHSQLEPQKVRDRIAKQEPIVYDSWPDSSPVCLSVKQSCRKEHSDNRKEETVTNSGGHWLADFLVTLFLYLS